MEKTGDLFNQLAIISDLLEQVNLEATAQTVVFEVNEKEFLRIYDMVAKKVRMVGGTPKSTFNVKIGDVDIVFNKNNA